MEPEMSQPVVNEGSDGLAKRAAGWFVASLFLTVVIGVGSARAAEDGGAPASASFPARGAAIELRGDRLLLSVDGLSASWNTAGQHLKPASLQEHSTQRYDLTATSLFRLELGGGAVLDSSDMHRVGPVVVEPLKADATAQALSERAPGWQATAQLADDTGNFIATWRLLERQGSRYFRQSLSLRVTKTELPVEALTLIDWPLRNARIEGSVPGSVIVSGNLYCGIEEPTSRSQVIQGGARCWLPQQVPLSVGRVVSTSMVVGEARSGQLRRDFQDYLNQERPRPYSAFLNYNSWYDIGFMNAFGQEGVLDVIQAFGQELVQRRGVSIASFVLDDGWDDHNSLWNFNAGFPSGFSPLTAAAEKYGAGLGVWLSPWGGYSDAKRERIAFGQKEGYETNQGGYVLSGPRYYQRFRKVCLDMIQKYGVNQFKFDGTGNASNRYPGSQFGTDFDAAIALIQDLRSARPDVYINLTTGTWPSPFWTRYADSIWRGGADHSFAGPGSWRQQWITFRDATTYHDIVQKSPLYPLNSLMLHGIIYASRAEHLQDDPAHDFADEVHDFFGTGTQMQEMYISHALLNKSDWDVLAESAKWSKANSNVLRDVHWVGGDPLQGEVYGFAAWAPGKGILTLRNPTGAPATIDLDPARVFELPDRSATSFLAHSPWQCDHDQPTVKLEAGQMHHFQLNPWQVLTLAM
jgi:hypothetical protein